MLGDGLQSLGSICSLKNGMTFIPKKRCQKQTVVDVVVNDENFRHLPERARLPLHAEAPRARWAAARIYSRRAACRESVRSSSTLSRKGRRTECRSTRGYA